MLFQVFTNRITLIQGPPGTGKTATAAWIVEAFKELGKKIVLTSGSNTAIDNVAKKLRANVRAKVARLLAESAGEKMPRSALDLYDDRLFPKEAERELLANKYSKSTTKWNTHVKKGGYEAIGDI